MDAAEQPPWMGLRRVQIRSTWNDLLLNQCDFFPVRPVYRLN